MPSAEPGRSVASSARIQSHACSSAEPPERIQEPAQGVELVAVQEEEVEGRHLLAEEWGIHQREDPQVEQDARDRDPPADGTEPEEEWQGKLHPQRRERQYADEHGIIRQPLEVELADLVVEEHVMDRRASEPGRPRALEHRRVEVNQAELD